MDFKLSVSNMHLKLIFAFSITASITALAAGPQRAAIDQDISQLVNLFGDGIAVSAPYQRHIVYGKVLGSVRDDAVAFFSIEGFHGGNYHAEYVAIFEALNPERMNGRNTKPFRLIGVTQIGGRGQRTLDWKSAKLTQGSVTVSGKKWADADAGCCPSISTTAKFRVSGSSVFEVR